MPYSNVLEINDVESYPWHATIIKKIVNSLTIILQFTTLLCSFVFYTKKQSIAFSCEFTYSYRTFDFSWIRKSYGDENFTRGLYNNIIFINIRLWNFSRLLTYIKAYICQKVKMSLASFCMNTIDMPGSDKLSWCMLNSQIHKLKQ